MNIDAKILKKKKKNPLGNQIQHHVKTILCHDQAGFIPEMKK